MVSRVPTPAAFHTVSPIMNPRWRPILLAAIGSTLCAYLCGQATPSQAVEVVFNLTYLVRDSGALQLDLYRPASHQGLLPSVICIADRSQQKIDSDHETRLARSLAEKGYVAAVVNYRPIGLKPFPAQLHDLMAAVRWLRSQAKTYGIDPHAIGAVGHAAGGHLATLLAISGNDSRLEENPNRPEMISGQIQAAVVSSAQTDLGSSYFSDKAMDASARIFWDAFLGGTSQEAAQRYQAASPLHSLDHQDPPIAFIADDTDHPSTRADAFRRQMIEYGIPTRLTLIKSSGEQVPQSPDAFQTRLDATLLFLAWHLRHHGRLPLFESGPPPSALQALFPRDSVWTSLGSGYAGCEGAQWIKGDQGPTLLFAAHHDFLVFSWNEKSGLQVWKKDSPEATAFRPDGSGGFYVVEQSHRNVTHWDRSGQRTAVLAERFEGKRLNRPNDLIVHRDGTLWFTDPDYLFRQRPTDLKELDGQYLYRLDPRSGELRAVVKDLKLPNGLAFSPDYEMLYFNDASGDSIFRARLTPDGTLSPRETFARISVKGLDGLAFDPEGNLWCAAMDGVHVFDRSGRELGVLTFPFKPTSIAFFSSHGAIPRVCVTTREAAFVTSLLP